MMKIIAWIAIFFFGSIAARVFFDLGYRMYTHQVFEWNDLLIAALGLAAIMMGRQTYRNWIKKKA